MRISTNQIFGQSLAAMLNQQAALSQTQNQISTGKRIINPSDDPAGSVQALNLQRELSLTEQYSANATVATNKLQSEETALKSAADILQRIRELAVQGLNDTNTQGDRRAISNEINQLNQQLLGLANTRDSNGDYLFSGFASNTQPYETLFGAYQGDEGQRNLKVGASVLVETNDPGSAVFEASIANTIVNDSTSPTPEVYTATNAYAGVANFDFDFSTDQVSFDVSVDGGITTDTVTLNTNTNDETGFLAAINAQLTGVTASISAGNLVFTANTGATANDIVVDNFNGDLDGGSNVVGDFVTGSVTRAGADASLLPNDITLTVFDDSNVGSTFDQLSFIFTEDLVTPGVFTVDVSDADGNTATFAYQPEETINLADLDGNFPNLSFSLSGTPVDADSLTVERSFSATPQPIFQTISNFADALARDEVGPNDSPNNGLFLTNLSTALENIVDTRAKIGGRINAIEQQASVNEALGFSLQKSISEISDLDYAEAITRLTQQLTGLEASQQTFTRVQGLSLFNFL